MLIDLREIIGVPGAKTSFQFKPDLSEAIDGSIIRFKEPMDAVGKVVNRAGALSFTADLDLVCVCVCARCLKEFELPIHQHISVNLIEGDEDMEVSDGYFIRNDSVDANEIICTEFILNMEQRLLCSEDCPGLCERCGAVLNDGQCSCKKPIDPRLAALESLLS